jgi:hypothetical protein
VELVDHELAIWGAPAEQKEDGTIVYPPSSEEEADE